MEEGGLGTGSPTTLIGTTHTHTRMRTYTHIHTHMYTHIQIRTYAHTLHEQVWSAGKEGLGTGSGTWYTHNTCWHNTHTHTYTDTYMCTHMQIRTYAHTLY
jgi:hypothetical protein